MKCYKIPVTWECWGMMEIEAESLKEAEYKARFEEPLPDENYIDDSLVLDKDNPHYGESEEVKPKKNTELHLGIRIPETSKSTDLFYYEIRYSDFDDMVPATVEDSVVVNFYGTLVCEEEIPSELFIKGEGSRYAPYEDVMEEYEIQRIFN